MYSGIIIDALNSALDKEVKSFLIRQLQLAGKDEAVSPLGALLPDERLCEPAAQALQAIGTSAAESELVKALPVVKGKGIVTIIRALGSFGSKSASGAISKYASSEDDNTRLTALWALANTGDQSYGRVLAVALKNALPAQKAKIASLQLLHARRVAEVGKLNSAEINREILNSKESPAEVNVQITALNSLADALGNDALEDILAAMNNPNKEVRTAALKLANAIPGKSATMKIVRKMESSPPEIKHEISEMLWKRGDESAMPALKKVQKDKEAAEGFIEIFNGKDLTGWIGDTTSYVARYGRIVIFPGRRGGGGNLFTEKEYSNFNLRFEFQLTPDANNGLGIRAPLEGDAAYVGMELQIIDNTAEMYSRLNPYQYHGSVYGVAWFWHRRHTQQLRTVLYKGFALVSGN